MSPITKQSSKEFVPFVLLGGVVLLLGILAAIIFPTLTGAARTKSTIVLHGLTAAPRVGIYVDKNLVVVEVVERGPAAAAGIKVGDVVKEVNGKAVPNSTKGRNRFDKIDKSKNVEITILRGAQEIIFDVTPAGIPGREGAPTSTPVPLGVTGF